MGGTRLSFDLQYLLGRPPWDTDVTPPEVIELLEGRDLPPGRALDLGCGTGTNCITLARHGWEAVGVDFSAVAIRRAGRKAHRARLNCQFYRADVTDLTFLTAPFGLVLDIGCLHSVPSERWGAYAAGVVRLLRPRAPYLLYAFTPRQGAATRGIAPGEVHYLFARDFVVDRQEVGEDPNGPRSAWYWLRRNE